MARLYETVVLVDANQEDAAIEASVQKFQDMLAGNGEIVRVDRWGKRKIAYEIDGKSHADYTVYYYHLANGKFVTEFERQLRLDESIIRFLTVVDNPIGLPPLDAPEIELPAENSEKED
ncbi:MAG: 30S ribosomal protein S6 [Fibrobacteria bacterium]|nr:30S ribosomal protein S6 [Fibrobacteria bacterium]